MSGVYDFETFQVDARRAKHWWSSVTTSAYGNWTFEVQLQMDDGERLPHNPPPINLRWKNDAPGDFSQEQILSAAESKAYWAAQGNPMMRLDRPVLHLKITFSYEDAMAFLLDLIKD